MNALELEELEQYLEETDLSVPEEHDCLLQDEKYPKFALIDSQVIQDEDQFAFVPNDSLFSSLFNEFENLREPLYDWNDHDEFVECLYSEIIKILPYTRFDAISREHEFSNESSSVERNDLECDISLFDFDRREVVSLEAKEDVSQDYKAYKQAEHNSEFFQKLSSLKCITDSVYLDTNLFLPKSIHAQDYDRDISDFNVRLDEELILEELSKYSKNSSLSTSKLHILPIESKEDDSCENNYNPTKANIYRPSEVAIFPKAKDQEDLAKEVYRDLQDEFKVTYKEPTTNDIKRTERADESAIPVSVTVDHESEKPYNVRLFNDLESYATDTLNSKEIREYICEIQGEYFGEIAIDRESVIILVYLHIVKREVLFLV